MSGCMETDKRVQILLSTYNGETYLRQQLESYLDLENFEICKVLIRDDGSSDSTREILEEYEQHEAFEVTYGENIGITNSYLWLLEHCDLNCEFFCLSDQDDVWLPDKIQKAVALLDARPSERMLLFASRSTVTDEELRPLGLSTDPIRGVSYYNAMIQNVLPGHTQIFNRTMRDSLVCHGIIGAESVDWWMYLLASGLGEVLFEPSSTVLHRQHSGNAVGYQLGFCGSLKKRLGYLRQGKGNAISFQLQAFLSCYETELPEMFRQETVNYLKSLEHLSTRMRYLSTSRVYRQDRRDDWKFRLLYLLGKY